MGIDVQFLVEKANRERDEEDRQLAFHKKSCHSSTDDSPVRRVNVRDDIQMNFYEENQDDVRESNAMSTIKKNKDLLEKFPVFKDISDEDKDLVAQGRVQTEFYNSVDNIFQLPVGERNTNSTLYVDKNSLPQLKSKIQQINFEHEDKQRRCDELLAQHVSNTTLEIMGTEKEQHIKRLKAARINYYDVYGNIKKQLQE